MPDDFLLQSELLSKHEVTEYLMKILLITISCAGGKFGRIQVYQLNLHNRTLNFLQHC